MTPASRQLARGCLALLFIVQTAAPATQFTSHVSVNTPARSYSHGVGNPASLHPGTYKTSRSSRRRALADNRRVSERGYPRDSPAIPFTREEIPSGNSIGVAPWLYNDFMEVPIPVLPPSPYRVDSPDPESLWPEGLFVPPAPPRGAPHWPSGRRTDNAADDPDPEYVDPYLVEGSEAVAAVQRGTQHGPYYFHDVPHLDSLLAYQDFRTRNNLEPHRIGSIRHTWPYNRP